MASTPVEFRAPSGLTLTLEVYPYGSDTIGNTGGDSAAEETNRKGVYTATVTEALTGWHTAHVMSGSDAIAVYDVDLNDTTVVHRCFDRAAEINAQVAGVDHSEAIRRIATIAVGKVSGAGTGTETFNDFAESSETVVVAVDDDGNRTGITFN